MPPNDDTTPHELRTQVTIAVVRTHLAKQRLLDGDLQAAQQALFQAQAAIEPLIRETAGQLGWFVQHDPSDGEDLPTIE